MLLNKPLVFLHIPRTAGSTFNSILLDIAKNHSLNYFRSGVHGRNSKFSFNLFESKKINSIYSGHFVFSDEVKEVDLYTIIRDPADFFVSSIYAQYGTYIGTNLNIANKKIIEKQINIELNQDYKDFPTIKFLIENNFFVSNTFTKTIAGIPFDKFFYTAEDIKINKSDYEIAKKNLKYFKLIGKTDKFNKFLSGFNSDYSFNIKKYINLNNNTYKNEFIRKLKEKFYRDFAYYNYFDFLLIKEIYKIQC